MSSAGRMMFASALTLCSVCVAELQQPAARSSSPSGQAQANAAVITFQFDRDGVAVPRYTIVLHEDGTGTYHAEEAERRSADSALQQVSLKVVDRPLTVTPETAGKVFQTARELKHFDIFCGTKAKNIASTGKKTLSYAGPDGTGSCMYNYSDEKNVTMLTEMFYAIAYTMDVGRKLEFEHRYDRLGLDAELISLEKAIADKNALELGNITPQLSSLASDTEVMQRVRTRAAKLLEQSAGGK
jgi:hypothetical protein